MSETGDSRLERRQLRALEMVEAGWIGCETRDDKTKVAVVGGPGAERNLAAVGVEECDPTLRYL